VFLGAEKLATFLSFILLAVPFWELVSEWEPSLAVLDSGASWKADVAE
jgi:hypothetical protein